MVKIQKIENRHMHLVFLFLWWILFLLYLFWYLGDTSVFGKTESLTNLVKTVWNTERDT